MTRRQRDESGAGVISLMPAVLVFLIMVFVAVHAAHGLFVGSTLNAVAYDAARISAQNGAGDNRAEATAHIHALIDAPSLEISWEGSTAEVVRLTLRVEPTNFLALSVGFLPSAPIEKTVEVRVEQPVPVAP
jgi:Flp pilus assembly protein TadG